MMDTDRLDAELAAIDRISAPDAWAVAAYRTAVARSESAGGPADLESSLALLERAAELLTAARSPIEHGRLLTAAANCHRLLGRPDRAAELFERAAGLIVERVPPIERAATLANQGLAQIDVGRPTEAIELLTRAIEFVADQHGDEAGRVHGAALVNRAQAHQSVADPASLKASIEDYRHALDFFDPGSPQSGMALHGSGAAMMELLRGGHDPVLVDEAIDAFSRSLRILTVNSFPFQHAVVQHSLALAYERRAGPLDRARAMACVETAMSMFDPRVHQAQWRTAASALERIERALEESRPGASRPDHFVWLLAATTVDERGGLLRERLLPLSRQPVARVERALGELTVALTALNEEEYTVVVRSLIPVLMELPDVVLESACASLCAAHQATDDVAAYDGALDELIHELLHGPQRVRVRDLLETFGWTRP
ncbi:MAG: hypothetical protein ABIP17_02435 [Ilumatobacteraceae bacterium]